MIADRIEINPRVCGGKPVIRGTRIPVSVVLEELEGHKSWEDVVAEHPELSVADIQAALRYARTSIDSTEIVLSKEA